MKISAKGLQQLSVALILCGGIHSGLLSAAAIAEPLRVTATQNDAQDQGVLHVNPLTGQDGEAGGTLTSPYKTISYALSRAQSGAMIKLAPGSYSATTGESFPLVLPSDIKLIGNEASQGQDTVIMGGGQFASSWWGRQNATIWARGNSVITGITVTNPESRGTGIWIESATTKVQNCTLSHSLRDGIFVAGKSTPTIMNNRFLNNSANGLAVSNESGGLITGNLFENTGFGVAISEQAQPTLRENRIFSNVDGVVISHSARPKILGNQIQNNKRDGVVLISQAFPNLGSVDAPGRNVITKNGRYAIQNASSNPNVSNYGNTIEETPALSAPVAPSSLDASVGAIAPAPALAFVSQSTPLPSQASKPDIGQILAGAKSISVDGKKYVLLEDLMKMLQ